jgi:hypothetical protein
MLRVYLGLFIYQKKPSAGLPNFVRLSLLRFKKQHIIPGNSYSEWKFSATLFFIFRNMYSMKLRQGATCTRQLIFITLNNIVIYKVIGIISRGEILRPSGVECFAYHYIPLQRNQGYSVYGTSN